jgi:DNA-binding SARP family transcriptional activator/TolB-like protein
VGKTVETRKTAARLEIRLLGPVTVSSHGEPLPLPRSRKVRALLAYLLLSPGPVGRSRLCDLLWDIPNDPRGELRWCLSKLRAVLGDAGRVTTDAHDLIGLDVSQCFVDVLEVDRLAQADLSALAQNELVALRKLFGGDLLDGLHLEGTPEFNGWLVAQRQRYRTVHVAILEELARRSPAASPETFSHLESWLELAPFDARAHEVLLAALVRCGRLRDADEHVARTIRCFEQEGIDWQPLRERWQAARHATPPAGIELVAPARPASLAPTRRRASVAIMPFVDPAPNGVGDGLTEDIITRLAKLRVLFVIARGSVFALSDRKISSVEAGRILNVEYVVSGRVRRSENRLSVLVELAETRDAGIIWADELHGAANASFPVLDQIVDRVVSAIADEIEAAECRRAVLKAPCSLDAWEAYHRGLWHMYKFTGPDNLRAEQFFRSALALDTTFARAHAGLSFTHFQNAFLDLTADRQQQIELAFEAAASSLDADDRDPAAHWAMGRALWLQGARDESLSELRRSIELSPNFALGHYTLGFVQSQLGDPKAAIDATDYARELSPFDPLQFAMLASRALAHVRLGQFEEAADWALKATARPNAHAHILAIATECLALANRRDEARTFVSRIRSRLSSYTVNDFLRAFRFPAETERLLRKGAAQIDFD